MTGFFIKGAIVSNGHILLDLSSGDGRIVINLLEASVVRANEDEISESAARAVLNVSGEHGLQVGALRAVRDGIDAILRQVTK